MRRISLMILHRETMFSNRFMLGYNCRNEFEALTDKYCEKNFLVWIFYRCREEIP